MREPPPVQRGVEERAERVVHAGGVVKVMPRASSPALGGSAEARPIRAGRALHDSGRAVGIFGHDLTPSRELRAVLPIVLERR